MTGLAGECQRRYVGTTANGAGGRYRYYTCYSRARYGPCHCKGLRLRADLVEPSVVASMVQTFADHERVRRAPRHGGAGPAGKRRVASRQTVVKAETFLRAASTS